MLPIQTSNAALFDVFSGEQQAGGEGSEGGAPGAFLELLSSLGGLGAQARVEAEAENRGEGGDSQDEGKALELLAQPGLPPNQHLLLSPHDIETLDLEALDFEAQTVDAGGPPTLEVGASAELGEGLETQAKGTLTPLAGAERSLQAQETRQQQQSVLNQGSGLKEAGQAIRALGGALAEGESLEGEPALRHVDGASSPEDMHPLGDPALAGEAPEHEASLADVSHPSPAASAEVDAATTQGESEPSGEESEGQQENLLGEVEAEDHELEAAEPPWPGARIPEPEAEQRGASPTRGLQAQAEPEVALPDLSEAAPLELEAVEGPSALEAAGEAGEVATGQDLIGQIELSIEPGQEEARIQLHPEELGRVDVRVRRREGRLVATLTVERPETTAEIEAHLPELRDALTERGLELDEVEVQTDASAFDLDSSKGEGNERGDPTQEAEAKPGSAPPSTPKSRSARATFDPSPRAPGAALDTLA